MNQTALEMRMSALEYIACKSYALLALQQTGSIGKTIEFLDGFAAEAKRQMFPIDDPALSDLASAEWEEAIIALVSLQKKFLQGLGKPRA